MWRQLRLARHYSFAPAQLLLAVSGMSAAIAEDEAVERVALITSLIMLMVYFSVDSASA